MNAVNVIAVARCIYLGYGELVDSTHKSKVALFLKGTWQAMKKLTSSDGAKLLEDWSYDKRTIGGRPSFLGSIEAASY